MYKFYIGFGGTDNARITICEPDIIFDCYDIQR